MCGIIGYSGSRNATGVIIDGLKRLEYRGYDSAGLAVLQSGRLVLKKTQGKIARLEALLSKGAPRGSIGIGHTRWATHGRPSETNAHPHQAGPIAVVHNGIIENYSAIWDWLKKRGHHLVSETDTEVISHLISQLLTDGNTMPEAFAKALERLEGSYALAVLSEKDPSRLYIARRGSPLVVGLGDKEGFVASDVPALIPYTRRVTFLEDGEWGWLDGERLTIRKNGHTVTRPERIVTWSQGMAEKGGYKHFMLKEIFEQPRALGDTLAGRIRKRDGSILLGEVESLLQQKYDRMHIVACGTSYHAGLAGRAWFEEWARIPTECELASEFRYRNPLVGPKTLVFAISQSGETADTLAAVREARRLKSKVVAICNVIDSSLAREADAVLYTRAGPEIGVASTKAFTTQLMALLLLAGAMNQHREAAKKSRARELPQILSHLPGLVEKALTLSGEIKRLAGRYAHAPNFLYIARGIQYPIALEGALKLKEISYIHAEGYAAGELKHGPIALIDEGMPVVVLAPKDRTFEKVLSNIEEVKSRGAVVIALTTPEGIPALKDRVRDLIILPAADPVLLPFLCAIPLQLLAYYIADHRGSDVDQPRNLAKSVTVE